MRLDGAGFPIVRMHYDAAGVEEDLVLFEELLARGQPFVVLAQSAEANQKQKADEGRRLSRWMRRNREPLRRLVRAMVYVEPQPAPRFIASATAPAFCKAWGYPLLVAASETEAIPTAERLLAGSPPSSNP